MKLCLSLSRVSEMPARALNSPAESVVGTAIWRTLGARQSGIRRLPFATMVRKRLHPIDIRHAVLEADYDSFAPICHRTAAEGDEEVGADCPRRIGAGDHCVTGGVR